jgi:hypothetical protein
MKPYNNSTDNKFTYNTQYIGNQIAAQERGVLFGRADYFCHQPINVIIVVEHGEFNQVLTKRQSYSTVHTSFQQSDNSTKRDEKTGVQGGFKYLFPKEGEELTADFNVLMAVTVIIFITIQDSYIGWWHKNRGMQQIPKRYQ